EGAKRVTTGGDCMVASCFGRSGGGWATGVNLLLRTAGLGSAQGYARIQGKDKRDRSGCSEWRYGAPARAGGAAAGGADGAGAGVGPRRPLDGGTGAARGAADPRADPGVLRDRAVVQPALRAGAGAIRRSPCGDAAGDVG